MMWGTTGLDRRINRYLIPDETLRRIRDEAVRAGVTFFDTAEGYGGGTSEIRLRRLGLPRAGCVVATKFLPTLWRWSEASFIRALRASNTRLGVECCDVYFIHTPIHPRSPDVWVRAAARAVKLGLMKELGVSNFDAASIRAALSSSTFDRPVARRAAFTVFISCLVTMYRLSNLFADRAGRLLREQYTSSEM